MRLLEAGRTAAVVFGAQAWPRMPALNGGKAFANSAADVKTYITSVSGLGLRESDVLDLFDSNESAADQLTRLGEFLNGWIKTAGGSATSLTGLFVYYVGHGDFVGSTNEFFMLVKQSRSGSQLTCLLARALADCLLQEAPHVRQVVVLDCCFSGAAHRVWMNTSAPHVAARGTAESLPPNGTVLICSSAENMPSMAPKGADRTMFTGALLDALRAGNPILEGGITPREARDLAFSRMQTQWGGAAVRPVLHALDRGSGDLSDLPLFPNPASQVEEGPPDPQYNNVWMLGSYPVTRRQLSIGAAAAAFVSTATISGIVYRAVVPKQVPPTPKGSDSVVSGPIQTQKAISHAIAWFREQFGAQLASRLASTPFNIDLLAAIAVRETYFIWGTPRPPMPTVEILKICVGDTLDAPTRHAFPRNKAALLGATNGAEMFKIAREALEEVVDINPGLRSVAQNPDKFVRSFGIFGYDLQYFLSDSDFFLKRLWHNIGHCTERALNELDNARRRVFGPDKTTLTDLEMVHVAIAYNTGIFNPAKGLKQGHVFEGKTYGENIYEYMKFAQQAK